MAETWVPLWLKEASLSPCLKGAHHWQNFRESRGTSKLGFTTHVDIVIPFSEDLEGAYLLITGRSLK